MKRAIRQVSSASGDVMLAARALRTAQSHLRSALYSQPIPKSAEARVRAWLKHLQGDVDQLVAFASDVWRPKARPAAESKRRAA